MKFSQFADTVLDRAVVPGYTRIGPAVRRLWWPPDPPADALRGRRVLITGGTSGLGKATAEGLARLGAHVHVHGHDPDHLAAAITDLRSVVPDGQFDGELCDLSNLAAVRTFGTEFAGRVESLDALVHNAGTMAPNRRETDEGHEFTLAVMALGPHLLTHLLRDRLAISPAATVTFMSSGGMYAAALRDDDPEYTQDKYSGAKAYARVKRMQVVLAQMWAERLAPDGTEVYSMHPGWVDTRGVRAYLPKFRALTLPFMRDDKQGADTMIWLVATRPDATGTERFWHDRQLRPTSYGRRRDQSPDKRLRLWDYIADTTDTPHWNDRT